MSIVLRMLARRVFVLSLTVVALLVVLASFAGPSRAEQLVASWYGVGDGFAGLTTANGETFDPYAYTAAHKTLPFDTKLEVTYGGESVVVRINDRGPYIEGRDLDLSYAAARDIGLVAAGSAPVEVEYVDPATPVGPAQTTSASPAPEPDPEPAPEPASAPELAPEPAPEPEPEAAPEPALESAQAPEPASAEESPLQALQEPEAGSQAPPEGSVGLAQYPDDAQVDEQAEGVQAATEDQYADRDQYDEEDPDAAEDQYDTSVFGASVPEPSGEADTPAAEFVPEQVAPEQVESERVDPEQELPQPSPATVVPPVAELEEPPEDLVKPGTTVEHRVEMSIAAAPGTATESPDTPDLAPAPPAEDLFVSGGEGEPPAQPESAEPAPETTASSESAAEAPEKEEPPEAEEKPQEDELQDGETQEVDIEVLPDTGGWAKLPGFSLADLVAVLLVATVLRSGLRRLRA